MMCEAVSAMLRCAAVQLDVVLDLLLACCSTTITSYIPVERTLIILIS